MTPIRILFILFCIVVFCQRNTLAQVHMGGVNHLALKLGTFDSFKSPGYHAGIYYSKVKNRHWWWRVGLQANRQDFDVYSSSIPSEKFLGHGTYFYTLGSILHHRVYFNIGLGALAGYERINGGEARVNESLVLSDRSKPVFGLSPEASIEIFLSNKVIFTLDYAKRVLVNSDLSIWDDVYGTGLKFYIH